MLFVPFSNKSLKMYMFSNLFCKFSPSSIADVVCLRISVNPSRQRDFLHPSPADKNQKQCPFPTRIKVHRGVFINTHGTPVSLLTPWHLLLVGEG